MPPSKIAAICAKYGAVMLFNLNYQQQMNLRASISARYKPLRVRNLAPKDAGYYKRNEGHVFHAAYDLIVTGEVE